MKDRSRKFDELSSEVRRRPGAAEEIDAHKSAIIAAVRLAELREKMGETQTELAELLGTTQANVSRIERADNLFLKTLADYVGALGGRLEINAVFTDDVVPLGVVDHARTGSRVASNR
jgi:DNA-binding XRE family transcriptional regulator